jgi:enamine deaminase RidA (YjgF/YER057c/UK114 family)
VSSHREFVEVEKTSYFMPYAPVIRAKAGGDLLFISGATALPLFHQHPHEHDKLNPPEDIREQTRNVMENLTRCLEAAGASWRDVVRTDVFLTDMEEQDAVGEVMGPYFDGDFPASTMVEVRRLVDPRLKIEVSAIAVVRSGA